MIDKLRNKIRSIAKESSGESCNVVYVDSVKMSIGGYKDLTPYSLQVPISKASVTFNAPNRTMVTFSEGVNERIEDRKSYEKYGGLIRILEPLTDEIAKEVLTKIERLKQ